MYAAKAYEEIIEFIAAGSSSREVVDFRPSERAQARVSDLVAREKEGGLTPDEKSELDHYVQLEHLLRLAKAKARKYLSTDSVR